MPKSIGCPWIFAAAVQRSIMARLRWMRLSFMGMVVCVSIPTPYPSDSAQVKRNAPLWTKPFPGG
ncbi:hypothetical protein [Bifidobacterium rousetti]|uniref:hypothetical protein n=1 Tax=Bifidobacterium rousetti TaxID=2045439 RepID=UPI00168A7205|nr:hypothetical protein [Bifidobacterium rousetti]